MRSTCWFFVFCLLLAGWSALPLRAVAGDGASVQWLESLVQQWVELETDLVETKQDWLATQKRMQQQKALLQKRLAHLSEQRQQLMLGHEQNDTKAWLQAQSQRQQVLSLLDRRVNTAAVRQRDEVVAKLPDSLKKELVLGARKGLLLEERLQEVLRTYEELAKMANRCHVRQEVMPTRQGQREEVDVLYLGYSRGYAVSKDNHWAALGQFDGVSWSWEAAPDVVEAVRQALAVLDKKSLLELSHLPLKIDRAVRP